jgi:hypothetical protein
MCIATLGVIGAGLSAGSSILGGFAAANSAHYQAAVAANNATVARNNAISAAGAASANNERAEMQAAQRNSTLRAGIAANNIDVNSGSAGDVQTSQRIIGGQDVATQAHNSALQVYGYETQATNYQAQSALDESQVFPDILGGLLKGGGTLLSNPDFDKAIGGSGAPAPASGSPEPEATGPPQSLISGPPSVPPQYQWMQDQQGNGSLY